MGANQGCLKTSGFRAPVSGAIKGSERKTASSQCCNCQCVWNSLRARHFPYVAHSITAKHLHRFPRAATTRNRGLGGFEQQNFI